MNHEAVIETTISKLKTLYSGDYNKLLALTTKELNKLKLPCEFSSEELIANLIRFLYIKKKHNNVSPPYLIDQIWHVLLLTPMLYIKVCNCIAHNGKNKDTNKISLDTMIDHDPLGGTGEDKEARYERYHRTLQLYKCYFPNDKNFTLSIAWNEDIFNMVSASVAVYSSKKDTTARNSVDTDMSSSSSNTVTLSDREANENTTAIGSALSNLIAPTINRSPASTTESTDSSVNSQSDSDSVSNKRQRLTFQDSSLTVRIRGSGEDLDFKLKKSTKIKALLKAYCDHIGVEVHNVRLACDGDCLEEDFSIGHYEIENGDIIDSAIEQFGC